MTTLETELKTLERQSITDIHSSGDDAALEAIKTKILGKKGALTQLLKGLSAIPPEDRPKFGSLANTVKESILSALEAKGRDLQQAKLQHAIEQASLDVTLPPLLCPKGSAHPIRQASQKIMDLFGRLGFSAYEGPDIETNFFNFTSLNIRDDHPARDMHDTFYLTDAIAPDLLLRTHTSPVQIRSMQKEQPPIRLLAPGCVYRHDSDTSHSPVFHQIEGLYVDKTVTFAQLKGCLSYFLKSLFGPEKKVRFRPSYFPFTEPSTEVDVECMNCNGAGCSLCKHTGWIEILGAGMVNREVFRHVGYDPDAVTGFAFGLGIDRIAMLLYHIPDIKLFYENDVRFLNQF